LLSANHVPTLKILTYRQNISWETGLQLVTRFFFFELTRKIGFEHRFSRFQFPISPENRNRALFE